MCERVDLMSRRLELGGGGKLGLEERGMRRRRGALLGVTVMVVMGERCQ